jgi:IMP cyclohydrolase
MGFAPNGEMAQVYWIMGRSENSKNRIFVQNKDGSVSTKAFDETKITDPSLIIYNPLKIVNNIYIIGNGDQVDTVAEFLAKDKTAHEALQTRTYEPDAPNYTPRITGVFYPNRSYALSIIKKNPERESIYIEREGGAEMITTYEGDSDPLISFIGLPKKMPIKSTAQENLDFYWNMLNPKYRVSLLVNWIANGKNEVLIKNEHA